MAYQKSKITVENESYEIAQAHDAQFKATSDDKDTSNSNTWTDIEPLEDEEINSNIFNKMSKMFSNVRYLYNELGGSGAITATSDSIQKKLDDIETTKIAKDHKHNTGTYNELKTVLPVVNYQNDSPHTIPTSSVLTAMNTAISDIQTNLATAQTNYDKYFKKAPNERYRGKNLGVWNTTSDVDKFCSTYTSPNYTGLCLGDYVTIMDGTYNAQWMIAGFDTENTNSSNNGVGICMIPKGVLGTRQLDPVLVSGGFGFVRGLPEGYYSTGIRTYMNNTIAPKLQKVLGSHMVNRNVNLTKFKYYYISSRTEGARRFINSGDNQGYNAIATNDYLTLMTWYQIFGPLFGFEPDPWGDGSYKVYDTLVSIFNNTGFIYRSIWDRYTNVQQTINALISAWPWPYSSGTYTGRQSIEDFVYSMQFHRWKLPIFDHISPASSDNTPYWLREPTPIHMMRYGSYTHPIMEHWSIYDGAMYNITANGYTFSLASNCNCNNSFAPYLGVRPFMYIR